MTKRRISRREAIATGLAGAAATAALGACGDGAGNGTAEAPAGSGSASQAGRGVRAVVIGAGAFGGWTALELLRRGTQVTLVDAWGPGNSRASSGGETRVIRATYGPHRIYSEMVVRALALWKEAGERWGDRLFHETGAIWMSDGEDRYATDAAPILRDLGLPFDELTGDELARRFPQINTEGLAYALHEKSAGYLLARRGCQRVLEGFLAEGGEYREAKAAAGAARSGTMRDIRLANGETLEADLFIFAGGPWLAELFPGFDPPLVSPTRQEILYFGTPPGRTDLTDAELPVWVETGASFFYGVPGSNYRGFKVADDSRGAPFDPTDGDRDSFGRSHPEGADLHGAPLPGDAGRPADRVAGLPVRAERRRAPHRGHPPGGGERLDRRRRVRARLQARPGPRGDAGRAGARRAGEGALLRAGAVRGLSGGHPESGSSFGIAATLRVRAARRAFATRRRGIRLATRPAYTSRRITPSSRSRSPRLVNIPRPARSSCPSS